MALAELARFDDVRAAMDRAMRLVGGDMNARLRCLVVTLRAAAYTGNLDEFDQLLLVADPLASASDVSWIIGYLRWSEMLAAAWRRDHVSVDRNHHAARALLVDLDNTRTSAVFLSESAEAYALIGQEPVARTLLGEAVAHPMALPRDWRFAKLALAVHGPDRDMEALLHDALDLGPISPLRRWRMLSDVIRAKRTTGRPISELEMDSLRSARDATGEADRLLLFDRELGLLAPAASSEVLINILGGFRVRCAKLALDISDGHITKMLKLLAARRGSAPADMVMEALWPDIDPELGRRRLKNVIRRTREQIGQQSILRTANSVALGDNVRIDFVAFEQHTRAALIMSEREPQRGSVVAAALDLYGGELLPDDLYDDWADDARASARSQYDALFATATRASR